MNRWSQAWRGVGCWAEPWRGTATPLEASPVQGVPLRPGFGGYTILGGSPGLATSWLAEDSLVGRAEAWARCHVKFLPAAVGGWGEGEVFLFFVFFPTESKGGERAFGRRKALELSLGPAHSESRSWPCARQLEGAGGKGQWYTSPLPAPPSQKRGWPPRRTADLAFNQPPTPAAVPSPSNCSTGFAASTPLLRLFLLSGCPSHPSQGLPGPPRIWSSIPLGLEA